MMGAMQLVRCPLRIRCPQPQQLRRVLQTARCSSSLSSSSSETERATSASWSEEWKRLGLGARLARPGSKLTQLLFVELGFGVDQHGDRAAAGATKAAVRAVRNAIEFNSVPGAVTCIPGGREEMLIKVKLGVPAVEETDPNESNAGSRPMAVDLQQVAAVFPYGRLLPIDVVVGGLEFTTGRIVSELGDNDDSGVCVAAAVSIGWDDGSERDTHIAHDTRDGL